MELPISKLLFAFGLIAEDTVAPLKSKSVSISSFGTFRVLSVVSNRKIASVKRL